MSVEVEDRKSPNIETDQNNFLKKVVHFWANINTDDDTGDIINYDITILDPMDNVRKTMTYEEFNKFPHNAPVYSNYDWSGLKHQIENVKSVAIEDGRVRAIENKKKTYNEIIYKKVYFYKQEKIKKEIRDSEERGVIIEKVSIDLTKNRRTPIKESEQILETFYAIYIIPENPRTLWIEDEILDDLLKKRVEEVRIFTDEGVFYINTEAFLNHGSVKDKKVYIDLNASMFTVCEHKNEFVVYDR